jgi:hypothetical protein
VETMMKRAFFMIPFPNVTVDFDVDPKPP